jgi:membrane-bound metal-dependent hydrolase YbcI (DUF457 family)
MDIDQKSVNANIAIFFMAFYSHVDVTMINKCQWFRQCLETVGFTLKVQYTNIKMVMRFYMFSFFGC